MAQQDFIPPWWLKNKHIQSIYASVVTQRSKVELNWEEITLPDGDFLDLAWAGPAPTYAPILILFHGLEGSVYSHYIQEMLNLFVEKDWRVVVMHYRSCSGRMNRYSHFYNAVNTDDVSHVVDTVAARYPDRPIFGMGFSLGGNLLAHYLAKVKDSPLRAGIAISMPYELGKSADYLVPFYQHVLLRSLKRKILKKLEAGLEMPVTAAELKKINTLRRMDSVVTAPLYGFDSVDDYYAQASSRPKLDQVQHPLLILHAMDDPFVPPDSVPHLDELSDQVALEISEHGGHMGFIKGGLPWKPSYWFAQRIQRFFEENVEVPSIQTPRSYFKRWFSQ